MIAERTHWHLQEESPKEPDPHPFLDLKGELEASSSSRTGNQEPGPTARAPVLWGS